MRRSSPLERLLCEQLLEVPPIDGMALVTRYHGRCVFAGGSLKTLEQLDQPADRTLLSNLTTLFDHDEIIQHGVIRLPGSHYTYRAFSKSLNSWYGIADQHHGLILTALPYGVLLVTYSGDKIATQRVIQRVEQIAALLQR